MIDANTVIIYKTGPLVLYLTWCYSYNLFIFQVISKYICVISYILLILQVTPKYIRITGYNFFILQVTSNDICITSYNLFIAN